MLALYNPKTHGLSVFVLALLTLLTSAAMAQQTPASRYQPVTGPRAPQSVNTNFQDGRTAPPSVHVPPASAQRIGSPVGFQFSDNVPGGPSTNAAKRAQNQPPTIRQTAFLSEETQQTEPTIPEILRRGPQSGPNSSGITSQHHPVQTTSEFLPTSEFLSNSEKAEVGQNPNHKPIGSPAEFSNQMKQARELPRVAPDEIDRVAQIRQEVEAIQQKIAERNQTIENRSSAANASPSTETNPTIPATVPTSVQPSPANWSQSASNLGPEQPHTKAQESNEFSQFSTSRNTLGGHSVDPNFDQPELNQGQPGSTKQLATEQSFDQFMANTRNDRSEEVSSNKEDGAPANMNVPASYQSPEGYSSYPGRVTSLEDRQPNTAIRLAAPALSVETFGPQSIGVNKRCEYTIVVKNESQQLAERVIVSIDFPNWVEIDKINLTTGEREIVAGPPMQRLLWKIDRVPAMASQSISITAIARKAEVFDLGVEWTLVPRAGAAKIQVTQPKLEMSIVGPDEVQFGESVAYDVTLRNTGTGEAENVIVMLSEALNGDRGNLGNIPAGESKAFTVNLFARTPGELELAIQASAENDSEVSASRKLMIRRANLDIKITGPSMRYAGTQGQYTIQVSNQGDARAEEVIAAMGLPKGVRFIEGIESFKLIDGGLRWSVGSLEPGQSREYKVQCQLNASGDLQLEVGAQAKGALQASHAMVTQVQTIADLVMVVNDPPGPLTTGEEINYEIVVHNRGTRAAKGVDVFMILSQGLEPKSGSGRDYRIPRDGAIQFATIPQIDPGEKVTLKVVAMAYQPGTHVFRAHLVCEEADSREIKEGTSRFFGDEIQNSRSNNTATESGPSSDFPAEIRR